MQKKIHGLCKKCLVLYKNFAICESKFKAENLRLFVCPACVVAEIEKQTTIFDEINKKCYVV